MFMLSKVHDGNEGICLHWDFDILSVNPLRGYTASYYIHRSSDLYASDVMARRARVPMKAGVSVYPFTARPGQNQNTMLC